MESIISILNSLKSKFRFDYSKLYAENLVLIRIMFAPTLGCQLFACVISIENANIVEATSVVTN